MYTILVIIGIWLLLNVLFVVAMAPPRKPRRSAVPGPSLAKLAPATIDKEIHPADPDEKTSISIIIVSVAMGAFFVLAPPIVEAADAIRRAFKRTPPAD